MGLLYLNVTVYRRKQKPEHLTHNQSANNAKKKKGRTQFGVVHNLHNHLEDIIKTYIIAFFYKHPSFNMNALRDITHFNLQFALLLIRSTEEH
jgi:hypothetical protein